MLVPRHFNTKTPCIDDFDFQKKLGQGTYGFVSKYIHKITKRPYAIKKMSLKDKQKNHLQMIKKQIEILYQIENKYIVELIDHFQNDQNQIFLIMEYIEGRDLHKSIFNKKIVLTQQQVATIIYQISIALSTLHEKSIIHRDLKLQNVIYLPNKSIKLVDLGCSNYYDEDIQRLTQIGTKFYFSPQLLSGDGQDDKLDVWCLGVLLYQLLFLTSPFKGDNMFIKIKKLEYQIPQSHKKDLQLIDLFKKIFCYKQKRIKSNIVFQHPWIQKHCSKSCQQINVQSQVIDKEQMKRYKQYLLQQIQHYQSKIQKIKGSNIKIKMKIKEFEDDQPEPDCF